MSQYRVLKLANYQFTKFSLIGMCNGAIDLLALNLMLWLWHTNSFLGLALINSFAYSLAVLNSYYWNSRLTFGQTASYSSKEKIKFVIQAVISLVISNIVFVLFTYVLGYFVLPLWIIHNVSKGLSMALSSICSFFFMKYLVYKTPREQN